jgi:hypothetical protein
VRDILGYLIGGAGGLVVGILIGALAFGMFGFVQGGGTNVPYDTNHSGIANSVRVQDKQFNVMLTVHHLQTGPVEFSPYAPNSVFPAHLQTTQSIWIFTSGADVDVYMTILGPGNDGHTFSVDFSRLTGSETILTYGNQTVHWLQGDGVMYSNIQVMR